MSTVMQEKYEQVSNLINLGKDRGFLLFDEVNEILPAGEHTAEEIDDLFSTVERNGIHIHQDVGEAAAHTVSWLNQRHSIRAWSEQKLIPI